jgi:hypothetical protein
MRASFSAALATNPAGAASAYPPVPMSLLAVRFLLELAMWTGCGMLGWHLMGIAGALLLTVGSMALWGVFGTPNDGVRRDPVVAVSGQVRLILELALFALAAWGIWAAWSRAAAETFLTVSVITYGLMWERFRWLLTGRRIAPSQPGA